MKPTNAAGSRLPMRVSEISAGTSLPSRRITGHSVRLPTSEPPPPVRNSTRPATCASRTRSGMISSGSERPSTSSRR